MYNVIGMFQRIKNRLGFTMVELLVVIAVVGILATVISRVAIGNNLAKSRDTKRLADLESIRAALELYYSDNKQYPLREDEGVGGGWEVSSDSDWLTALSPYMATRPVDPRNGIWLGGALDYHRFQYIYANCGPVGVTATGQPTYKMMARLETTSAIAARTFCTGCTGLTNSDPNWINWTCVRSP